MVGNDWTNPALDQQWINDNGRIALDPTGTRYSAVLDPKGIASIALNSASGGGFYNVRRMSRPYLAQYNQNFMRNFTIVDVTPERLSVLTYQVNHGPHHLPHTGNESVTLVDVYTIVRSDANGNVPAGVDIPTLTNPIATASTVAPNALLGVFEANHTERTQSGANEVGQSGVSETRTYEVRQQTETPIPASITIPKATHPAGIPTPEALGLPTEVSITTTLANNQRYVAATTELTAPWAAHLPSELLPWPASTRAAGSPILVGDAIPWLSHGMRNHTDDHGYYVRQVRAEIQWDILPNIRPFGAASTDNSDLFIATGRVILPNGVVAANPDLLDISVDIIVTDVVPPTGIVDRTMAFALAFALLAASVIMWSVVLRRRNRVSDNA
jgi:hypothetical protein